jgi:hypothetical protein
VAGDGCGGDRVDDRRRGDCGDGDLYQLDRAGVGGARRRGAVAKARAEGCTGSRAGSAGVRRAPEAPEFVESPEVIEAPPRTEPEAPVVPPPPTAPEAPQVVEAPPRTAPAPKHAPPSKPAPLSPATAEHRAPAPKAPLAPPAESALAIESKHLKAAVDALRTGDAAAALREISAYEAAHANGVLHREALLTKVSALVALDRETEALGLLDAIELDAHPRSLELTILRGELRVRADRCGDANSDFTRALTHDLDAKLRARAEHGLARCKP